MGVAPLEQNLLNEAPHWRATLRIMGCVCCCVCWCAGRGGGLPPPFLKSLGCDLYRGGVVRSHEQLLDAALQGGLDPNKSSPCDTRATALCGWARKDEEEF